MLRSSRDECGAGESQRFLRMVLVARAAGVKTSLVWCHLFLGMENVKEVKETGHRKKPQKVLHISIFSLFA